MLKGINFKSDFLQSIVVLTSGTLIAQVVSYLATPIITRLFTPEEIGELGVFLRVTAFIASVATARYELTLPLPKNQNHAFQLFRLSVNIALISLGISLLFGLGYWVWSAFDLNVFWYVLLVVSTSFFMIFRNIGTNWAIRNKAFKHISVSGVVGSMFTNGIKIAAGFLHFGVIGLIVSHFVGAAAAVVVFIRDFLSNKKHLGLSRSPGKMKVLAGEYKDFPRVNMPHALIDNGRELMIAFFVVEFFDQAIFGSYDHSFRMLKLPLILVGASMGQVFFNRCSTAFSEQQPIYPLLKKTTLLLTVLSIVPFSIIFFFGEEIFVFVFGSQWAYSGQISEIIAPWLMVNFIASPISTVPLVIGKQRLFFWLGLVSTIIQLLGFGLLPILMNQGKISGNQLFWVISLSMSAFLIVVILIKLNITKKADALNGAQSY
jgi:teichuronic acid exporter